MKVICCKCKKEYPLEDNIFETDKANRPILKCPYCEFKHLLDFIPFERDLSLKKVERLNLTVIQYVILGASRIANANRVDQSGVDDGDVTGWTKTNDFILATRIYTSKGPIDRSYKLRWRNVTDAGTFVDVATTGEISFSAVTVLVDGASLTSGICSAQAGYTWQNGLESEEDNLLPDSGTYSLADEYYSEFQWALDCNSALDGKQYEFELYEVTNGVAIGTCLAAITMAVGAVTYTKSFTADAILQATTTKGLTVDAIIVYEYTKGFQADAILQATYIKDFTADAYLQATYTKDFTSDAILQATYIKGFIADSLLQATFIKDFTSDAYLQKATTKPFTADAILQAPIIPGMAFMLPKRYW